MSMLSADVRTLSLKTRVALHFFLWMPIVVGFGYAAAKYEPRPEYTFVSATAAQQADVLAYKDIVGKAHAAKSNLLLEEALPRAERVAGEWRGRFESGELKPLPSVAYEDICTEGPKAAIYRPADDVANTLVNGAASLHAAGQSGRAAQDALLGIKLLDSFAGLEFGSMPTVNMRIRRILLVLATILPSIPDADATRILGDLNGLFDGHTLGPKVEPAIALFNRSAARDGLPVLAPERVALLRGLEEVATREGSPVEHFRQIRAEVRAESSLPPRIVTDVTLSYLTEFENRDLLRQMRSKVRP